MRINGHPAKYLDISSISGPSLGTGAGTRALHKQCGHIYDFPPPIRQTCKVVILPNRGFAEAKTKDGTSRVKSEGEAEDSRDNQTAAPVYAPLQFLDSSLPTAT
jgi:hypothetical protein